MEHQRKTIYETMAEITGTNPTDVEMKMKQNLRTIEERESSEYIIISDSFPSFEILKEITKNQVRDSISCI